MFCHTTFVHICKSTGHHVETIIDCSLINRWFVCLFSVAFFCFYFNILLTNCITFSRWNIYFHLFQQIWNQFVIILFSFVISISFSVFSSLSLISNTFSRLSQIEINNWTDDWENRLIDINFNQRWINEASAQLKFYLTNNQVLYFYADQTIYNYRYVYM